MLAYILRRALFAIFTIWAISIISFFIIQLPPGDYVTAYIAQLQASGTQVTQDTIATLRNEYGLDQPFIVQYGKWMRRIVHGDLGVSLQYKRPVSEMIGSRLSLTMVVSIFALLLTWAHRAARSASISAVGTTRSAITSSRWSALSVSRCRTSCSR